MGPTFNGVSINGPRGKHMQASGLACKHQRRKCESFLDRGESSGFHLFDSGVDFNVTESR